MSSGRRRRRSPVSERGRAGRFLGGLVDYARTAWWGLVSPKISESRSLVIAQAVILRDGSPRQVLLSIRSDLFGWELPGGTLERGETPEQAVIREVREETGLEIECVEHVGVWVRHGFRPHQAHVFGCRVVGGVEQTSHETPRLRWFDVDRPPEAIFPWYEGPLREALVSRDEPFKGDDWQGIRTILRTMEIDLLMRWRGLPDSSLGKKK